MNHNPNFHTLVIILFTVTVIPFNDLVGDDDGGGLTRSGRILCSSQVEGTTVQETHSENHFFSLTQRVD